MKIIKKYILFIIMLLFPALLSGGKADSDKAILLQDDFNNLRVGMFSAFVKAFAEYHYLPEVAPKGNWVSSTHEGEVGSQRAWWIFNEDGQNLMVQTYDNPDDFTHPIVIAGDPLWTDYKLTVKFKPLSTEKQSGVVFRYENDRCFYFFGIEGDKAVLKMAKHGYAFRKSTVKILAEKEYKTKTGEILTAVVNVNGSDITASFDNGPVLKAKDDIFPKGKIGLMSDVPTKYYSVLVTTSKNEFDKITAQQKLREEEELRLQAENPKLKLWKKIKTYKFGVGRNLRFGDLNNDGQIDVLIGQVLGHGPKGAYNELYCITAMTFDGEILWQIGKPDILKYYLTTDLPFQIHDLDNDGKNEVIYCKASEIIVADGATGKTKYKKPTPFSKPPATRFEHILGDCLYFCDLSGKGYDSDIIIKDRQTNFWVLNDQLDIVWEVTGIPDKKHQIGHYPFAYDIDNDGKDELAIGYAMYDDDGTKLWSHDELHQHADGIAILNFNPGTDSEPKIFWAGSDEGALLVNLKGEILKHHFIGHVQNPSIANYRDDLPGLETVSINFHGNQGIITYYDSEGNIYKQFEPVQHGSMMLPLNWKGDGEEYFVLSPDVLEGGIYDGWGRRVVAFPGDGHPVMCNATLDITGDARDEIVVWDPYEIWVYTQDDNPKTGKIYKPTRNSLYNYSNYQATFSSPGWTE
jgi:hypothetical protein